MTTSELKSYIDRILGNNIRLLLPSYWWKRAFGAVIDKVDEKVEKSDLKTINGQSILGSGNLEISGTDLEFKTINGQSILGSGNLEVSGGSGDLEERVSNIEEFFEEGAKLNLAIKSNQGTDKVISEVKAIIAFNDENIESGSGVVGLPVFTDVTITFPEVEGYKTPEPLTFTTGAVPISYTVTYETEVVNVALSAWDGASVIGQVVTINGKSYTWDGNIISQKIPYGIEYWIIANDKEGYVMQSLVFTASAKARDVELVYVEASVSWITIDQNISDPATRISGDINGEHIQLIRSNSHRYLGKYTSEGTMTICQLQ